MSEKKPSAEWLAARMRWFEDYMRELTASSSSLRRAPPMEEGRSVEVRTVTTRVHSSVDPARTLASYLSPLAVDA